ncbi:MAG: lipopolysaccharide transport periplasmic protein LptA [Gammaproteobacteria bacterium]|nr:lipopolysaccharide transport periplasmic protein LptA [Gammaproteobacteria bacterium]
MKSSILKSLAVISYCWFATLPAYALKADREQPIEINADSMVAEEPKGFSHYKGNVQISQGSLRVEADEVIIYFIDGALNKLIIKGQPAHLQQLPENNQEPVFSKANLMEYYATTDQLFLIENAEVKQGDNLFSGEHIEYDTRNSTVSAKSNGKQSGRVQAIIVPQKKVDTETP